MESKDIVRKLFSNAYNKRIPLVGTMELTDACNLRCVHCYIDEDKRDCYLPYEKCVDFIDEFKRNGGMYLTLTGGEALLHPDFAKIYLHAFTKGLLVTVFTNGSCFTGKILDMLEAYPPYAIEITLYGFSQETYLSATGKNVFLKCVDAINELSRRKLNVLLKMFIHKLNFNDFESVYAFAQNKGLKFKFDPFVVSRFDDHRMSYQIEAYRIKEILNQSVKDVGSYVSYDDAWRDYIHSMSKDKLFRCGAGKCVCWLKANNTLQACNFLESSGVSLDQMSFAQAWSKLGELCEVKPKHKSNCSKCSFQDNCSMCPAKAEVIHNDVFMEDKYPIFCEIAKYISEEQRT